MAFRREFKVGVFVLAGLIAMGFVIFMIGEERRAFGSKDTFYSVFSDVQGLRRGSPVRMGGVDIGSVSEVAYGADAKDARIFVRMSIVSGEARRIRGDSVASIEGKGLLGDKMIVLTVGSVNQPQLTPGSEVPSKVGDDMAAMLGKLGAVSAKAEKVMVNLERTTESLADAKLHEDLKASVNSLSHILGAIDRREGYVGKLFSDPAEAERVSRTMANLERVSNELELTTRNVNQVIARVQNGPGLAHEVLYGEEGSKAVSQFGSAAEEFGLTLKGIREGKGLARSVLFGGDDQSERLAQDLNGASADLRQIIADLRAGRGTLGALLVDPSVYEDLKLVLGNVERNKALRALVRYSIRKDEGTPKVRDTDPGTAPSSSTPAAGAGTLDGALGAGARVSSPSGD
ncbi:MAG TPA: MlaD family protein [Polyangiaceae bacterium]|nr:MlaD family protein [Polyangiaceae bacterium]